MIFFSEKNQKRNHALNKRETHADCAPYTTFAFIYYNHLLAKKFCSFSILKEKNFLKNQKMKCEKDLREIRGLFDDTQYSYSEVCNCFYHLVAKSWRFNRKEDKNQIPSIANDEELREIQEKINKIDIEISESDEYYVKSPTFNDETVTMKQNNQKKLTHERAKVNGKRVSIPWNKVEINAIKEGIKKIGLGKWSEIRKMYFNVFSENGRTSRDIMLKVKSLQKQPDFKSFVMKYGK